jgi:hypothetical protein
MPPGAIRAVRGIHQKLFQCTGMDIAECRRSVAAQTKSLLQLGHHLSKFIGSTLKELWSADHRICRDLVSKPVRPDL